MSQDGDERNTTKVIEWLFIKKIPLIIIICEIVTNYTSVYLNFDVLCHRKYRVGVFGQYNRPENKTFSTVLPRWKIKLPLRITIGVFV